MEHKPPEGMKMESGLCWCLSYYMSPPGVCEDFGERVVEGSGELHLLAHVSPVWAEGYQHFDSDQNVVVLSPLTGNPRVRTEEEEEKGEEFDLSVGLKSEENVIVWKVGDVTYAKHSIYYRLCC